MAKGGNGGSEEDPSSMGADILMIVKATRPMPKLSTPFSLNGQYRIAEQIV
jgi:hypothetical protein